MVQDQNKGGLFIRLGVTNLENKRFSIYIPKGNGVKSGWVLMAEMLRRLGCYVRGELTKKGHDVVEVINGENLCGSSGAVKGERDRSGEGGAIQEGVEPKHGETGSLPGGELEP